MKYLKKYEKYIHTSQDKIDDMSYIEEFSKRFEEMFEYRLDIIEKSNPKFRDYLGFGAEVQYNGETEIYNSKYYKTERNIKYSINIETNINPNGIKHEYDIERTFLIKFEIKRENRLNNRIVDFYDYSTSMDAVLLKFDKYVLDTLNIKYLTEEEIEIKKIKKNMKNYNL